MAVHFLVAHLLAAQPLMVIAVFLLLFNHASLTAPGHSSASFPPLLVPVYVIT
jgi:hypothetical protein